MQRSSQRLTHCVSSVFMSAHCSVEHDHMGVQYPGSCACPNDCLMNVVHGMCGSWGCMCAPGYQGSDCSQVDCSSLDRCSSHGECVEVEGEKTCVCDGGYVGNDCSVPHVPIPPPPKLLPSHQYSDTDKYQEDHPVFNTSTIAQIRMTLPYQDMQDILNATNVNTKEYKEATFWFYNGAISESRSQVGFRIKGGYSRKGAKKTFKISFNEFTKGGDWKDLKKINLKGISTDPSLIREAFSTDVAFGLDTYIPRYSYAMLYVNDVYYGLYIMLENVDSKFVKSRFGSSKAGALWKTIGFLEDLGDDPAAYESAMCGDRVCYDPKTDQADDFSILANFIGVINRTPDEDFAEAIQSVLDVDMFLRSMAFEIMTGNWDGLKNGNNYYLFWNNELQLMQYIRYDQDVAFGTLHRSHPVTTIDVFSWGDDEFNRGGALISRVLAVESFRTRLAHLIAIMAKSGFDCSPESAWPRRYKALQQQMATPILQDKWWHLDAGFTMAELQRSWNETITRPSYPPLPFEAIWVGVGEFCAVRTQSALEQVASYL
eukprot:TRINITY_DN11943_c0_g1_i2.p1 TRINITY_DN11943_c0_g1~~TRINITY_DN11943_c0_g1_i2.p1  ORF type:complete len:615 (+),score=116.30 TRINITY_DN11943_c0_g1_i2:217-1845(+)